MAYVLCLKHLQIISKTGHAAILKPSRQPQPLADPLLPEALALGCVRSNERGQVLINDTAVDIIDHEPALLDAQPADPAVDLPVREKHILQAVKKIVSAPDGAGITTTGVPRVYAVSEACGFRVSQSEVMQALKQIGL